MRTELEGIEIEASKVRFYTIVACDSFACGIDEFALLLARAKS